MNSDAVPAADLPGPLVDASWLAARLDHPDIAVVDCRFQMNDPGAGEAAYEQGHVPGAVYFHLDRDLSAPARGQGGRHPLPAIDELAAKLGRAGIGSATTVIAYDDQGTANAARFWWLLRFLGHDRVAVLDGGYRLWVAEGFPVSAERPQPQPRSFEPRPRPEMLASMEEVRARLNDGKTVIVDSRAPARYRGETEPLDPIAGRIPGAVNFPWEANLTPDGRFRPPQELAERFAPLRAADDVIVYCGSGVTACVNLLALHIAGKRDARLYAGSWSEWCAHPDNPVAKG